MRDVPEPPRISRRKRDKHGRPVPWFVAWLDGIPDFRLVAPGAVQTAWVAGLCWVCGIRFQRQEPRAFVIGPMCVVNRIAAEPPLHHDCATYSALACPFLATPRMVRREKHLPPGVAQPPGVMIRRNPGVTAVWVAKYTEPSAVRDPDGLLFRIGEPMFVEWYSSGRTATRAEIVASIDSGLPLLAETCDGNPAALTALDEGHRAALSLVPAR